MDIDFPTRVVREGLVDLLVPDIERRAGPGTRSWRPFYNPAMAVGRDISVLLAGQLVPSGGRVLDGLAATGALGLRIARESGQEIEVVLNDKNPSAVTLIRKNIERNGIRTASVTQENLNAHLGAHHYELVEVDPFGSPAPFLDAALLSARRATVLGITATDTAVLCGAKPEAARRRYLARVHPTDAYAEVGARILLGYIARMAARFDKAIEPLLALAAEHFVKVHLRIAEGASRAEASLSRLGWVRFDPRTGAHDPADEASGDAIGPMWLGPLWEPSFAADLTPRTSMGHQTAVLLDRIRGEATLPPFYFEANAMARRAGVSPAPLHEILAGLRERGHRAARTHFRENAFRTDATGAETLGLYRDLRHP